MSRPAQARRRRAPLHPVPATVCGLVSICLLFALPVATAAEPDAGLLPGLGSVGWWTVVEVLVLQALAVAWVGRFPTTVLPGLAAVPLVLVWAGLSA